CARLQSNYDYW
nr:immunoglobulin heavy chain junction region [Macaca mulatta]MOV47638.1 immunoglobulin heavy chain junction region [Macaca mulatta]MOV47742.1 immunoglobulin heavy chain junction region [Macaca mulatta]MOV48591.1 immunoglobulin heavy chain junction region [Macaca mulatta]MOV48593.1 immunoglobulin heavy chain junction region [Macaca mulatta]